MIKSSCLTDEWQLNVVFLKYFVSLSYYHHPENWLSETHLQSWKSSSRTMPP